MNEINSLSVLISQEIAASNWEQLSYLLLQRHQILIKILSQEDSILTNRDELRAIILKIQKEDESFLNKIQDKKNQLSSDALLFKQGLKSVIAYNDI